MTEKKRPKASEQEAPTSADPSAQTPVGPSGAPGANAEGAALEGVSEEQVSRELADVQDRLLHLAADYQNYQKRAQKQIAQAGQFAREEMVRTLLPVLDNLELALSKGQETEAGSALLEGVRIVYEHLTGVLAGHGLRRIAIEPGSDFDPKFHEAVLYEPTAQYPPNQVVRELAGGYTVQERILRPAKVSVAQSPGPTPPGPVSGDATAGGRASQPKE